MIKGKKTVTLTIRITPETKEFLKTIAENEDRSMSDMIESFILNHHKRYKLYVPKKLHGCIHGLVSWCNVCEGK